MVDISWKSIIYFFAISHTVQVQRPRHLRIAQEMIDALIQIAWIWTQIQLAQGRRQAL